MTVLRRKVSVSAGRKTAGLPCERYVAIPSGESSSRTQTKRGGLVAVSNRRVLQMDSDEVNWLLQTIETPEGARRFVMAQFERGRIPFDVMTTLARERGWSDWDEVEASRATAASKGSTTTPVVVLPATDAIS